LNKKVALVGALVVVPLVLLLAVSFKFDPKVVASPLIGKPAADFSLQDLDGRTVRLEDLRGDPIVINFWATYCPPCIEEHPLLVAAAEHYAGRVHFLGVVYQDDPALIRRFVAQLGAWGPTLLDPDGKVAIAYGVYGPPETFFIDRGGLIADKVIGAVNGRHLRDTLERLLAEPAPADRT
jgi:cytochrome c biogenesis protein CcmG/thiol:disulfide interchange protein DsbE